MLSGASDQTELDLATDIEIEYYYYTFHVCRYKHHNYSPATTLLGFYQVLASHKEKKLFYQVWPRTVVVQTPN